MERELKITLAQEDLAKFIVHLHPNVTQILNQDNHYYTSDHIKQHKFSFRVRCENGQYIMTTKKNYVLQGGYAQCEETNAVLDVDSFHEFEEHPEKYTNYYLYKQELYLQS